MLVALAAGIPKTVSERRVNVRGALVDHTSQGMGGSGLQPCLGPGEMVANFDACGTGVLHCMEDLGEMHSAQMEATTGQNTGSAH